MPKFIPLLFLFLTASLAANDAAAFGTKPKQIGGTGADWAQNMVVDASGNIYITGVFQGDIQIDSQTRVSQGSFDIYLAKLSSSGSLVWLKSFGSAGDDQPLGLTLASDGKLWLAGYFSNSIQFGGTALRSNGAEDIFVARFNTDGSHLQSVAYGGTDADFATNLSAGKNGEVYMSGSFASTELRLDTRRLTRVGATDGFLARLSADGSVAWARHLPAGPGKYSEAFASVSDKKSFAYVAGYAEPAGYSVFVEKVNANNGTGIWREEFPCGGWCNAVSLGVDSGGELYVAGNYERSLKIGAGTFSSQGGSDLFLAKIRAASGNSVWTKILGGAGYDIGISLEVVDDSVFTAASVVGTMNFGNGLLTPGAGKSGIGVARYSIAGAIQWSNLFAGSDGTGTGAGYNGDGFVRLQPGGDLVVNGWFPGAITVDSTEFRSKGSWDSILIFLNP